MMKLTLLLTLAITVISSLACGGSDTAAVPIRTIVITVPLLQDCVCTASVVDAPGPLLEFDCGGGALAQIVVTTNPADLVHGVCDKNPPVDGGGCKTKADNWCKAKTKATVVIHSSCGNRGVTGPGLGTSSSPCTTFQPGTSSISITWEMSAACTAEEPSWDEPAGAYLTVYANPCAGGQPSGSEILRFKPKLSCNKCEQ